MELANIFLASICVGALWGLLKRLAVFSSLSRTSLVVTPGLAPELATLVYTTSVSPRFSSSMGLLVTAR